MAETENHVEPQTEEERLVASLRPADVTPDDVIQPAEAPATGDEQSEGGAA